MIDRGDDEIESNGRSERGNSNRSSNKSKRRIVNLISQLSAEPDDLPLQFKQNNVNNNLYSAPLKDEIMHPAAIPGLFPPRYSNNNSSSPTMPGSEQQGYGYSPVKRDSRRRRASTFEKEYLHIEQESQEFSLRYKLSVAYRICFKQNLGLLNLDDLISVKLQPNKFLIKPYDIRFDEVEANNLIVVDSSGFLVGTKKLVAPSTFLQYHVPLYELNSETTCIANIQHNDCSSISLMDQGLLPLNPKLVQFKESCGLIKNEHIFHEALQLKRSGDNRFGKSRKKIGIQSWRYKNRNTNPTLRITTETDSPKIIKDKRNFLIQNYGAISTSPSIEGCVGNIYHLTTSCTFQLRTLLAVGGDVTKLQLIPLNENSSKNENNNDHLLFFNRLKSYI